MKISVDSASLNSMIASKSAEISKRSDKAVRVLDEQLLKDTTPFVPYNTGELSNSGAVLDSGGIEYTASYASGVYNLPSSTNFNTSVHSEATGDWFRASVDKNFDSWVKRFAREVGGK